MSNNTDTDCPYEVCARTDGTWDVVRAGHQLSSHPTKEAAIADAAKRGQCDPDDVWVWVW